MLLVFTSLYTRLFPYSSKIALHGSRQGPKPSVPFILEFFRLEIATEFVFWLVLYSVKYNFLIFYRHIFGVSGAFMKAWWGVFTFTTTAFLACFLSVLWSYESPSKLFVLT